MTELCMTELCDELSVVGEPVKEEDRVVYLLASLPDWKLTQMFLH